MSDAFPTLNDFVLAPPLSPLISILMTCGMLALARRLARAFPTSSPAARPLLSLMFAAGIVGLFAHAVLWAGLAPLWTFRVFAGALMAAGASSMPFFAREIARRIAPAWTGASPLERAGDLALALAFALYFLLAISPVVEIDALNYHLGVPVDWLREGRAYPRFDWLHCRLVGLGEGLVTVGLAAGTEGFVGMLQLLALGLAWVGLRRLSTSPGARFLSSALLLSAPVIRNLVFTQKFQLMPALGMMAVAIEVVTGSSSADVRRTVLVGAAVGVAVVSKHTFLLTAAPLVVMLALPWLREPRLRWKPALGFLAAGILVALPFFIRNVVFYGDPIPPFLERFRPGPDPEVVSFARFLRAWGGRDLPIRWVQFPFQVAAPFIPGQFVSSLGLMVSTLPFLVLYRGPGRRLGLLSLSLFAIHLAVGQLHARMLLDPFLVIAAGAAIHEWRRPAFRFLLGCAHFQYACSVAMLFAVATRVQAGAWTPAGRLRVQRESVCDFLAWESLNASLPPGEVILTNSIPRCLIPRKFVVAGEVSMYPDIEGDRRRLSLAEPRPTLVIVQMRLVTPVILEALEGATGPRDAISFPEHTGDRTNRPASVLYRIAREPAIPPRR